MGMPACHQCDGTNATLIGQERNSSFFDHRSTETPGSYSQRMLEDVNMNVYGSPHIASDINGVHQGRVDAAND